MGQLHLEIVSRSRWDYLQSHSLIAGISRAEHGNVFPVVDVSPERSCWVGFHRR